jgi:UDP-N-acetylglucosamine 2-epimerase (non-hydrolysing)
VRLCKSGGIGDVPREPKTLRDNTERPETLEVGANILAGASPDRILECSKVMLERENNWENPFGDGKAEERIVEILESAVYSQESRI